MSLDAWTRALGQITVPPIMPIIGGYRTSAFRPNMSALPPKADICRAQAYVRFGPKADMASHNDFDDPHHPLILVIYGMAVIDNLPTITGSVNGMMTRAAQGA